MNMWVRAAAGLAGGMVAVAQLAAPTPGLTTTSTVSAGPGGVSSSTLVRGGDGVAVVVVPEATGRLLITVTSDAKRVLLEWRTAANTKATLNNYNLSGHVGNHGTELV